MLISMPDPGPIADPMLPRAVLVAALRQARQMVAQTLEEAADPEYTEDERYHFRRDAFSQRCIVEVFAALIGDTSDDLGAPGDPTPAQVRAWGVAA